MKVAIFGASGLVGRELRELLDEKEIPWIGTYNKSSFPNGVCLEKTDTSSLIHFIKEHQITHCINCVAERNVDLCEKQWEQTYETNCAFAARLAEACLTQTIYFLHISTDYVFDGSQPPYSPQSNCHPIQAYGKSKCLAEQAIQEVNKSCAIVRVPVLYTHRYKTLLETAVTMLGKKVLDSTKQVQEDNYFIRRPVFIEDFAVFLLDCVDEKKIGTFHFYNSKDRVTKYEMTKLIGDYLQKDTSHIQPIDNPSGLAGRPYDTQLIDHQYDRISFPDTSIEKGIAQCFAKFKHPRIHFDTKPTESIFYMIDLDGTLVDTDRLHYDCYKKAFEQEGFQLCDYETYESLSSFETYAREICGIKYNEMKESKNKFFYETQAIQYMPGAEAFLSWLATTKQNAVVVTNTSRQTVEFIKSKAPLLQTITQWITRDDVSHAKPHKEPYALAKSRFYKDESYVLGIENTMSGYFSLRNTTSLIYMLCEANSYTHKQLQPHDVYCISKLNAIQSKKYKNYYFFGEFGYFHQTILAYMERLVQFCPERKGTICLYTFEGNDVILEKLFPGYFNYVTVPLHPSRGGYHSLIDKDYPQAEHISHMLIDRLPHWLGDINYKGDLRPFYLKRPIPCPINQGMDLLRQQFTKTVVLFFRKRDMEPHRNYTESNDEWTQLMKSHIQDPKTLCCIYALSKEECIVPSYVNKNAHNVYCMTTIDEAIYFFHHSDIVYMGDTGLADFAKNCAAKKIIFHPNDQNKLFIAGVYYNPFQTQIEVLGDYTFGP